LRDPFSAYSSNDNISPVPELILLAERTPAALVTGSWSVIRLKRSESAGTSSKPPAWMAFTMFILSPMKAMIMLII
jgi:hypothetical protein